MADTAHAAVVVEEVEEVEEEGHEEEAAEEATLGARRNVGVEQAVDEVVITRDLPKVDITMR
jgi:hypothetical protein